MRPNVCFITSKIQTLRKKKTKPSLLYVTEFIAEEDVEFLGIIDLPDSFALSTPQAFEPRAFEPQVDTSALGAFAFVFLVFAALQYRTNQVNNAAIQRKESLEKLRILKMKELANGGSTTSTEVKEAAMAYEGWIVKEEKLRTLIPGVRIVAPNGPASASEEEVAAAKQLLGLDLKEGVKEKVTEENSTMSSGAVAVLALIGISQIILLIVLSFDPMQQSGNLF
mmetsp:Transcript_16473/g.18982  ORF Transcript_16473/g.18982 Transcript_16473/m.18982 type:complete len:224 (-) Transcript_16473:63-734(-)